MCKYRVLGAMSGSSLDGLDVSLVEFDNSGNDWSFDLLKNHTIKIPDEIIALLQQSSESENIAEADYAYGRWIGHQIKEYFSVEDILLIGIHGHTSNHKPEKKISLQIGNAGEIARITNRIVVDNFRIQDIMKGGQGAPLVPVGEKHLFPEFDAFLNLGGICNASIHTMDRIIAWDIAPCNQVFNFFAKKLGQAFDDSGHFASVGHVDQRWLDQIRRHDYFDQSPPKSIGNHWVKQHFLNDTIDPKDGLRTFVEFLAIKIAEEFNVFVKNKKIHTAGGGLYNKFLIDTIQKNLTNGNELILPTRAIVDYKEALIFGFMGLLKYLDIVNVHASVTGGASNTIAGYVHLPTE